MSTVYRAEDTVLNRSVAVKILSFLDADAVGADRARSEIRMLASLSHRGLVTLFDADTTLVDGQEKTFLVMELVDGPSLGERLREGAIAEADVVVLATELAEALVVIHDAGIVHRDIKPGNVLLGPSVVALRPFDAKLADFGIAILTDRASTLTATGMMVGTAAYLSPEQPRERPATTASDIYSLGLVLLEALTGRHPFPGSMTETLAARMNRSPEIPTGFGYRWRSLLTAMTALAPEDRPTAREVLQRLAAPEELPATLGNPGFAGESEGLAPTKVMTAEAMPSDASTTPTALLPSDQGAGEPRLGLSRRVRIAGGVAALIIVLAVSATVLVASNHSPATAKVSTSPTAPSSPATGPASTSSAPAVSSSPNPVQPVPSTVQTAAPTVQTGIPTTSTPAVGIPAGSGKSPTQGNGNGQGKGHGKNK
ncbi:hypothetical protein AX769_01435 [Frondihabitans sp. PAMC 28766]|nr:hypothetical protein AX769_01435 [Frondihabitans sp. PAMC 28766]